MIELFSFVLAWLLALTFFALGAISGFVASKRQIEHYKCLYEISERRCDRFYDRLLDKENEE